jgi:UDP-N-acetylmuramate--alanine ligase
MDADHLDIYGTAENMQDAFVQFANQAGADKLLLTKFGLPDKDYISNNHIRYSLQNSSADVYASNITMKDGGYVFDVMTREWMLDHVQLHMGGMHNVENIVAAIFIAHYLKISPEKIRAAVESFKGVKRRFEYVIGPAEAKSQENNVVFIDDYAHHPEELNALIRSAKSLFSDRKCTVIFQPHLFSRTKDFADEFAKSLDMANEVWLLPIYPARELPLEGVTSEMILDKMENKNARVVTKEQLLEYIQGGYLKSVQESFKGQLLITAGAGNIDQLVQPIKKILLNNN